MPFKTTVFPSLLLFVMLCNVELNANELSSYQWRNRVLVVDLETVENENNFMKEVHLLMDEYEERKLVIIYANSTHFEFPNQVSKLWLSQLVAAQQSNFILIGLDGDIKRTYNQAEFSHQSLFDIVDGMPMRKAELKAN